MESLMHYGEMDESLTIRLACGFIYAHDVWTPRVSQTTCPECIERLAYIIADARRGLVPVPEGNFFAAYAVLMGAPYYFTKEQIDRLNDKRIAALLSIDTQSAIHQADSANAPQPEAKPIKFREFL